MDTLTGAVVLIVSINDELSKDVRTQPVDWDKYIVNDDTCNEDFAETWANKE